MTIHVISYTPYLWESDIHVNLLAEIKSWELMMVIADQIQYEE